MQHLDMTAAPDEGPQENFVRQPVSIAVRVISERFNLSLELATRITELANFPAEVGR
jgi:hypothetical protein